MTRTFGWEQEIFLCFYKLPLAWLDVWRKEGKNNQRIVFFLFISIFFISLGPNNFTKAQAVMMIQNLSVDERKMFLKELKKIVGTKDREVTPSYQDLRQLAYHNSLPFVGFGFLDNFVMIIAGEYIDITLGSTKELIYIFPINFNIWRYEARNLHDGCCSSWQHDIRPSWNWISLVCRVICW